MAGVPTVMPHRSTSDWDRPVLHKHRDPFLTRIWTILGGLALLVPVILILRPASDGATHGVTTAALPGAVAAFQPGGAGSPPSAAAPAQDGVATDGSSPPEAASTVPGFSLVPAAGVPDSAPATTSPPTEPSAAPTTPVATVDPALVAAATVAPATNPPPTSPPAPPTTPATTAARPTTTTAAAPACAGRYEVRPGDSWSGIASAFGVTLSAVLAANGATTATNLYPGDTVCLPPGAAKAPATTAAPKPKATTTAPPVTTDAPKPKPTTTTDAPKPKATPTTVPSRTYSREEVEQIIRDVFPDELEEHALEIARRESNYKPTARNWCCYGLFQIHWSAHKSWLAGLGVTDASQLFDPLVNATAALALYNRSGGWGPWGG